MRLLFRFVVPLILLLTGAVSAWSADGRIVSFEGDVNVEAMIGEATLIQQHDDGHKDTVVVPTGQVTKKDPASGKTLLVPATVANAVNIVVHAIAATAPDPADRLATDEGCSRGSKPQRNVAHPDYDAATATAIADQLAVLSKGDLMLVMAVLINNAAHLCIDSATVAHAINVIATVRPDAAADVVFVASLLDPTHSEQFTDTAIAAAPSQAENIKKANDDSAVDGPSNQPQQPHQQVPPLSNVPPGGGGDPSPE